MARLIRPRQDNSTPNGVFETQRLVEDLQNLAYYLWKQKRALSKVFGMRTALNLDEHKNSNIGTSRIMTVVTDSMKQFLI